jgi:hypothetical protein
MKIHIGWMVAAVVVLAGMAMQQGESTEKWEYGTVSFLFEDEDTACFWPSGSIIIEARLEAPEDDSLGPQWTVIYSGDGSRVLKALEQNQPLQGITHPLDPNLHVGGILVGADVASALVARSEIVLDLVGQYGWQVFQVDTTYDDVEIYHLRRRIK